MNLNFHLLAHSADTPVLGKTMEVAGLPIEIEHAKGTQRVLHNNKGKVVYRVHMFHSYGFLSGTRGRDGDEVDVFVGPIKQPKDVYIVHMQDLGPDVKEREDEDKVMLGFPGADAAKKAFLLHYPATFFESMTVMPLAQFKKRLADTQKPHTHNKLHAKAGNLVKKTYTIETTPEVLPRFEAFLAHLEHCAGVGHSCTVAMDIDGDGPDAFYVTPKLPSSKQEPTESERRVETVHAGRGVANRAGAVTPGYRRSVTGNGNTLDEREHRGATISGRGKPDKCPECGGKKLVLKPTDFETAECKDCGHQFQIPALDARLRTGKSPKTISQNIGIERRAGKPQDQAVAIAYEKARKG